MSESSRTTVVTQYGVPAERAVCVGGGPVAALAVEPDADRYRRQNIVFVGYDWERKGGPEVVDAFAQVRRQLPNATLTIVGASPAISQAGVDVVGPVPPTEVGRFLGRASAFCMPSRREPFGLVYIEAMHAGLPVVARRQGAVLDFVIDEQTGFLVDQDPRALADALVRLLRDPDRCAEMGKRARTLVETRYTWEHTQRVMWDAIRPRLSEPRQA